MATSASTFFDNNIVEWLFSLLDPVPESEVDALTARLLSVSTIRKQREYEYGYVPSA